MLAFKYLDDNILKHYLGGQVVAKDESAPHVLQHAQSMFAGALTKTSSEEECAAASTQHRASVATFSPEHGSHAPRFSSFSTDPGTPHENPLHSASMSASMSTSSIPSPDTVTVGNGLSLELK